MIWFRRIVAIPLALVFVILFVCLLVVQRVNSTAGNPDFYIDQLRQADIYNFMYHDILPAAIDEIKSDESTSQSPFDIEQLKSRLPDAMEQALPPEWLQARVEQSIEQVLPYVLGDTDSFSVTVPLKDRVEAVAAALKDLLNDDEFFNGQYDQAVLYGVDKFREMEDLPSFLQLSDEELTSLFRSVLPPEWIQAQAGASIDAIVPYLTGESDTFTVRIDISDRMDALESALTDILMRPAAYEYMLDEQFVPYMKNSTQALTTLTVGISFTENEVVQVVEQVFTLDWYRGQVDNIVGQVFSYLKGDTDIIQIIIPVGDLKPAILTAVAALADQKLLTLVDALPIATPEQEAALLADPPQGILPPYRPAGMSYTDFKALLGINVTSLTASFVDTWLPEQFIITSADIHNALAGEGDEDLLTQVRDIVRDGFTYTEADLYEDMADNIDTINDVRDYVTSDYTFTDADLQEYFLDSDDPDAAATWDSLQDVRSIVGTARQWLWAAWLAPALLLVGIAFLGGRNWRGRVIWGASVLAVASLIALIAAGPVFSALAKPPIDDAIISAAGEQTSVIGTMAADKGVEMAEDAVNSFVGVIYIESIVIFAVCLVVIAVVVWHPWSRGSRGMSGQVSPPDSPPPVFPPAASPPGNFPSDDSPPPGPPPDSPGGPED